MRLIFLTIITARDGSTISVGATMSSSYMIIRHRKSSGRPQPMFTHGEDGRLVLSGEVVSVRTDELIVRIAPGRAKCTLCNRHFNNDAKQRIAHVNSPGHQRNLEKKGQENAAAGSTKESR